MSLSSGAGGKRAYEKSDEHVAENEAMGMNLEYFTEHYGFTFFSVSKTDITVSFVGADGNVIYQYTRKTIKLNITTAISAKVQSHIGWFHVALRQGL